MKKLIAVIAILLCSTWNTEAAAPTRAYTYVSNTTIDPAQNNANENALYTYLQAGVDTYSAGSITGAALSPTASIPYSALSLTGSIVRADLSSSSFVTLPSGAIFFMVSGSCPTGTTDVSSSYSNKFVRINATAGSTGGADTHTHGAGSYLGPSHSHTVSNDGWGTAVASGVSGRLLAGPTDGGASWSNTGVATGLDGTEAVTGTSASGDNVPAYVTMKACLVS